jgi:hypothetical protein
MQNIEKPSNKETLDHYQGNSMIKRTTKKDMLCMMIPSNCLNLREYQDKSWLKQFNCSMTENYRILHFTS